MSGLVLASPSIEVANSVLSSFFDGRIEKRRGGTYVCWHSHYHGEMTKRWMCRGQDFYPVWHRKYPGGGTSTTALSQLVRWVQSKPVLPISTWRMWASEKCQLLPMPAVDELIDGGYPVHVNCVLCHNQIEGGLDWWSLDKVSGPCCGWTSGCRQKP
jgi:hypothetical protein